MTRLYKTLTDFAENKISEENIDFLKEARTKALEAFVKSGFPDELTIGKAEWRNIDIEKFFHKKYHVATDFGQWDNNYVCDIDDSETAAFYNLNGSNIIKRKDDSVRDEIIVKDINDLDNEGKQFFGSLCDIEDNGFNAVNTAAFTGGFYINVPDNTNVDIPIQLISVYKADKHLFFNGRNLIILGKNSSARIIQCDDDLSDYNCFINIVTEVKLKENAHLELYKTFNFDDHNGIVNSVFIEQDEGSSVKSFNFELNAGLLRNNLATKLTEENCNFEAYGVYLADQQQLMDNFIKVEHSAPKCNSEQIFKGILDDVSGAIFTGNVIVDKDAQQTNASQTNRNILLSDKACMVGKPYLQIYADDVKCGHGATTGQLDEEALYYMRQRGISLDNARKLLMTAFLGEIVDRIGIEDLKHTVSDMISKRLQGNLKKCDSCVLHCRDAKKEIENII